MLAILLVVVLIVLIFSTIPTWDHSRGWGPSPSAFLLVLLVIVVLLAYSGRL